MLGTGKKLFPDGFTITKLTLVESLKLRSGVVVNIYRREKKDEERPVSGFRYQGL